MCVSSHLVNIRDIARHRKRQLILWSCADHANLRIPEKALEPLVALDDPGWVRAESFLRLQGDFVQLSIRQTRWPTHSTIDNWAGGNWTRTVTLGYMRSCLGRFGLLRYCTNCHVRFSLAHLALVQLEMFWLSLIQPSLVLLVLF